MSAKTGLLILKRSFEAVLAARLEEKDELKKNPYFQAGDSSPSGWPRLGSLLISYLWVKEAGFIKHNLT